MELLLAVHQLQVGPQVPGPDGPGEGDSLHRLAHDGPREGGLHLHLEVSDGQLTVWVFLELVAVKDIVWVLPSQSF